MLIDKGLDGERGATARISLPKHEHAGPVQGDMPTGSVEETV